jgi:FtsH-binding integral membrane protein
MRKQKRKRGWKEEEEMLKFMEQYLWYVVIGLVLSLVSYQIGYWRYSDELHVAVLAWLITAAPSGIVLTYNYPMKHKLKLVLCGCGTGTLGVLVQLLLDLMH